MKRFVSVVAVSCLLLGMIACSSDDDNGGTGPANSAADLSLAVSVDTTGPEAGDEIVYTLTLCNAGPDAATNVSVETVLPTDVSYVSHTGSGTYDSSTQLWTVTSLAASAGCATPATLEITAMVGAGVASGVSLAFSAEITTSDLDDPDSTPDNGSATEDDDDEVVITTSDGGGVVDDGGFVGAFEIARWVESGITGGTTMIEHPTGVTSVAAFSYDVDLGNPGGGVSERFAEYTVLSPITGTISYDFEYTGFHAFSATAATFVASSNLQTIVELDDVPVGGGFTVTGTHTVNVVSGQPFSFRIGGRNFDSNSRLNGTLTVSNLTVTAGAVAGFYGDWAGSEWSKTDIAGGTTAITPASGNSDELALSYDVNLGSSGSGVSSRTTIFSFGVPESGSLAFDWDFSGFHAFFSANAVLLVQLDSVTVAEIASEVGGSFTFSNQLDLNVLQGSLLTVEVGGSNFDSNSRLMGTVTLSNMIFTP